MYTPTNSYTKKISSGTIVALLALSGILFLVPAISSVHAAGNVPPTLTVTNNQYYGGGSNAEVDFNISNPSANQFGITKVNITAPNLWTFVTGTCAAYALPGNTGDKYFTTANCLVSPTSPHLTTQWNTVGSYTLPSGGSQDLAVNVNFPNYGTYGAQCGIFTSEVWDTNGGHYAANTFKLCNFNPASDIDTTLTSSGGLTPIQFVAGSPALTFSVALGAGIHESGIGIFFQAEDSNCASTSLYFDEPCTEFNTGAFSGTGVTLVAGHSYLAEAWTNASGIATVTYTPSNMASAYTFATEITAYLGGGPTCQGFVTSFENWETNGFGCDTSWSQSNTIEVDTIAADPTVLAFTLGSPGPVFATHYITTHHANPYAAGNDLARVTAGNLALMLGDKFGNNVSVTAGVLSHITLSVSASTVTGGFDNGLALISTITYASGNIITDPNGAMINVNYYQSGTWGSSGQLSAILSAKYIATGDSISLSVNSGFLVTSTFDNSPNAVGCADCGLPAGLAAGSTETVSYGLTTPQLNVPITFLAFNHTIDFAFNGTANIPGHWLNGTMPYDSLTGASNMTGATKNSGMIKEKWAIDTAVATPPATGSSVKFQVIVWRPTDLNPNGFFTTAKTAVLTTTFGTAVTIYSAVFFDKLFTEPTAYAFVNAQLYIDVYLIDAYGNVAPNTFNAQITVDLTQSGGTLTSNAPYISSTGSDTGTNPPSFGPVKWTTAGTTPNTAITLTAVASIPGQAHPSTSMYTLNIVNATPAFTAKATTGNLVSGIVYSKTLSVSFAGTAAVSMGWDPALAVGFSAHGGGVYYFIDNGHAVLGATGASPLTWKVINVIFTQGIHTVTFYALDSKGDRSANVTVQVVIDTSAPTLAFTTKANANLIAPATVLATITDSEGDLNMVGNNVSATATSGSTVKALTVGLQPSTNNPGHPVTYNVTITGLTAGTWTVRLNATDLAGNFATKTLVVNVAVPIADTFTGPAPTVKVQGGFEFVNATFSNNGISTFTAQVWFQMTNAQGQVVFLTSNQQAVAPGGSVSVLFGVPTGLPAGQYTAQVFVYVGGQSYSPAPPASVVVTVT